MWDAQAAAERNQISRHPHLSGVEATLKAFDALQLPGQTLPLYRRYE